MAVFSSSSKAVIIGGGPEVAHYVSNHLRGLAFDTENFPNTDAFLFDGRFHPQCFYIIYEGFGIISARELIRLIRMKDRISLIYAVCPNHRDADIVAHLQSGADFCVKHPLVLPRMMIEAHNYFSKLDLILKK